MARGLIHCIVSGGQTGADRAGLDFAIAHDIEYGGWVPKGGIAEDMKVAPGLLAHYPLLQEAATSSMSARTKLNVQDSDATLIIRFDDGPPSPGTRLTIDLCQRLGKPYVVIDPNEWDGAEQFGDFVRKVQESGDSEVRPVVMNVAGPRASKSRGIYDAATGLLIETLDTVDYVMASRSQLIEQ